MSDPAAQPAFFGPVPAPERIVLLDVLRGLALLGILMVNVQFFAMPVGELFAPSFLDAGGPWSDVAAWAVTKTLFEYKFISLFSLLFGAGMVVQMTRAEQRGRRFVPVYVRRLLVLAGFGLAHAFLLWYGDILFVYSYLGAILLLCRRWRPTTMLIIAGAIVGAFTALYLMITVVVLVFLPGLRAIDMVPTTPPDTTETTDEAGESPTPLWSERNPKTAERFPWVGHMLDAGFNMTSDTWVEAETDAYRDGPWTDAFGFRAVTFLVIGVMGVFAYGWRVLAMFLVGAAFMKLGLFSAARHTWHRRLALVGLCLGVPLEVANTTLVYLGAPGDRWELAFLGAAFHELGSAVLMLGIVGATALVVYGSAARVATGAIACVGRLALSNYLLQTVAMTFLMYWWGLGWFGDVSRPQQIGLVVVIYGAQLVASVLWMKHFSIGPAEWLWRSLTYLKPQPLRRR